MSAEIRWVTPDWLDKNFGLEMTILDCQPNVHDYIKAHIPGAIYLSEENLRFSLQGKPHVWADEKLASSILTSVGVKEGSPILVYTSSNPQLPTGDGVPQGMIAYSLARYGHGSIMILDGGLDEWRRAGGQVTTQRSKNERVPYIARIDHSLFIGYEEFVEKIGRPDVVHIDSRPSNQYRGISPWPKEGHIPGAINIPWSECVQERNLCLLLPRNEIERRFELAGVNRRKKIICHCGSGRKASAQFVVLKYLLGYPDVRLFEGSFTEWCAHEGNKTVTGENPW